MGYITRQELHADLRAELDSVRDYIDGSVNEKVGEHMNNKNNPHNVTKAQVGLGNVANVLQASKSEFDTHVATRNPHGTTASDVGAVPTSRRIITGTGLTGGGSLDGDLTIGLNLHFFDFRYLARTDSAWNAERLQGYDAKSFFIQGHHYLSMGNNDGIAFDDTWNEFYFDIDGVYKRAYHTGNITYGTANPSGGKNGDIYIQY